MVHVQLNVGEIGFRSKIILMNFFDGIKFFKKCYLTSAMVLSLPPSSSITADNCSFAGAIKRLTNEDVTRPT